MPQLKRIYCAFHSAQFITNFCVEPACLMPLCPLCIISHNEFHKNNNSESTYTSIQNVLGQNYNNILSLIRSFENEQKRIENITSVISEMPHILHLKLQEAKRMTINQIELTFETLEKEMILKMCDRQEEALGPNLKLVEDELKVIEDSLTCLQKMLKSISGERCLSTVIKFLDHQHQDFLAARNALGLSINSMECQAPFLNISQDILDHLPSLLRRFVTLEFGEAKQEGDTFDEYPLLLSTFAPPKVQKVSNRPGKCNALQPAAQNNQRIRTEIDEKQGPKCQDEMESVTRKIEEMRKCSLPGPWANKC